LLHVARGLSLRDGIAAVARGAAEAATRMGTEVRLICTALRSHDPAANADLAETAAGFRDVGLTAFDLAGPEAAFPDPALHARSFAIARDGGLAITIHAGEWGGAPQVRHALAVEPARIAHGPGAIDDADLCRELTDRNIALDLCPTSNWQAGIVPSLAAHPLARLHRLGVPVTLSTDDTTVSDLSLVDEYDRALDEIGVTPFELWTINRRALNVAFADEATLARLRAEFDAWATGDPLLGASRRATTAG
jgi:adenosine deaminase